MSSIDEKIIWSIKEKEGEVFRQVNAQNTSLFRRPEHTLTEYCSHKEINSAFFHFYMTQRKMSVDMVGWKALDWQIWSVLFSSTICLLNNLLYCIYHYQSLTGVMKPMRMRWAGHIACMRKKRNADMVLVGKLEGKRPLGRHRRMWEDNIKMYL